MSENDDYPRDLRTATRAEYVTRIRMANKDRNGKKDGCFKAGATIVVGITVAIVDLIIRIF